MEIKITRIDGAIKIVPAPPYITDYLQYTKRSIGLRHYQRVITSEKINLFTVDPDDNGVVTLQGFFVAICKKIHKHGDLYTIEDLRTPLPYDVDWVRVKQVGPRDYQIDDMIKFLLAAKDNCGIVLAAGGYGKTFTQMMTYAAFNTLNTILAVPTRQIFQQTFTKFVEYFPDKKIGRVGNGSYDISDHLTISTFKSLENCALERCQLLLVDEIQGTTSDQISNVLAKMRPIRVFGYTATDDGLFNNADKVIKGLFGERLINITYKDAQEAEAVVPVIVYFVDMPDNVLVPASTIPGKLSQGIKNCKPRNQLIGDVCKLVPDNWQTIIFVDHIRDHLVSLLKEMPDGTRYVHRNADKNEVGKIALSPKQQDEVVESFCKNEFQYLIATDAFRAGFDMQNCRVVVQASGGTSKVEVLQEALRGSRVLTEAKRTELNVTPKTHLIVIDIMDKHDVVLENMSMTRLDIYQKQGWQIRRVKDIKDIQWQIA